MRGDDELRLRTHQIAHGPQQGKLPQRRKRGFRLIQQIKAAPAEAMEHQGEKAFPVGLPM